LISELNKDAKPKATEETIFDWKSNALSKKLGINIPVYKLTDKAKFKRKDIIDNMKYQSELYSEFYFHSTIFEFKEE